MRKILLAGAALGALTLLDNAAFAQRVESPQPYATSSPSASMRTAPGVQVRLAGRYRFFGGVVSQDNDDNANTNMSSVDFIDYVRLYPGFDGMAENGLQYGAQVEIRQESGANARGGDRGRLTYRRMYGYAATPTMGEIRVGSGAAGAVERMHTGHIMGLIASGLWDGDLPALVNGSADNPSTFWFASSGGNNQTKIGYYSPRFAGFDIGVSFAPSSGNFGGDTGCATGSLNCDRLSESTDSTANARIRNLIEVMGRYRGTFGPVAVNLSGGWYGSDTVGALGTAQAFQNLSIGVFGAQMSVAGFTFGGITTFGQGNHAMPSFTGNTIVGRSYAGLTPLADSGFDDGLLTWQLGLSYTAGKVTVGAAYSQNIFEGSQVVSTNARDQALGIGGSYNVAPGFNIFAEYLMGRRKEAGVDVVSGRASGLNNAGDSNTFAIGSAFNW